EGAWFTSLLGQRRRNVSSAGTECGAERSGKRHSHLEDGCVKTTCCRMAVLNRHQRKGKLSSAARRSLELGKAIIAFDELKTDYKNPIDQCNTLNPLVLPEYLIHAFFCVMFLCAAEWLTLGLNMPLLAYHIWRYMSRPVMSGPGLYDPTTIMNADILAYCQKEGWCKLAFYLLAFFYYLYGMIYVLADFKLLHYVTAAGYVRSPSKWNRMMMSDNSTLMVEVHKESALQQGPSRGLLAGEPSATGMKVLEELAYHGWFYVMVTKIFATSRLKKHHIMQLKSKKQHNIKKPLKPGMNQGTKKPAKPRHIHQGSFYVV
ncbi:hypothetical protein E2I00_012857, partial [Balaenoptera physalus]